MVYEVSLLEEKFFERNRTGQREIILQEKHTVSCHICKDEWVEIAGLF